MATDSAIRVLEALAQELRLTTGPNAAPLVYEVRYAVERAIASLRESSEIDTGGDRDAG